MCGIAGYVGYDKLNKSALKKTLNSMKNRGPDFSNYKQYNVKNINIYLLHSRLSIIDLDQIKPAFRV